MIAKKRRNSNGGLASVILDGVGGLAADLETAGSCGNFVLTAVYLTY